MLGDALKKGVIGFVLNHSIRKSMFGLGIQDAVGKDEVSVFLLEFLVVKLHGHSLVLSSGILAAKTPVTRLLASAYPVEGGCSCHVKFIISNAGI